MYEFLLLCSNSLDCGHGCGFSRSSGGIVSCHATRTFSTDDGHSKEQSTTPNESGSNDSHDKESPSDEDIKQKILAASLQFVQVHGFSRKALIDGAETVGYPSVSHGMFPKGGADLVNYFYQDCNKKLAENLEKKCKEMDESSKPSTRVFIQNAVEDRLMMLTPHIEQWPQAMALQALPQNACQSWCNLLQLVDDIWFYAGDKSTDFNWYTKRLTLAALYKSSEIYMLQDKSEDFENTLKFVNNRFDDVKCLGQSMKNCQMVTKSIGENLWGLSLMARNIMGINSRAR
ncbi:ubiquinone biosynthesis protein COQ9-B, mitochondrial isoform X2 [Octopus bimaculoides]|uniref:ubiquinone biosynthesis protein COQ9-B, mitochondrial isoform X2 n=1 Tax=Octopus bimaculoides TaxID=37653 RepID=UPI00071D076B|nr:ubiquinone biosynthesis protein COQ9-B, mitochondrial isoform X2 [Octopus bimaculoides]|eukprot:XP_014787086.1 PREDICTED: ubiquinone biosynthesis protein COQ9-B, mitochondrial-like [Octopus bimaculoides]